MGCVLSTHQALCGFSLGCFRCIALFNYLVWGFFSQSNPFLMQLCYWNRSLLLTTFILQGYVVCPSEKRFLLLFTFLKKNRKKKLMVFFSSCMSVKYHYELLNYIDLPVLAIHVSVLFIDLFLINLIVPINSYWLYICLARFSPVSNKQTPYSQNWSWSWLVCREWS